jgi:4-carboxymuconolactone decarboxylase
VSALPADIDPESRNRLPLVKREDFDDAGKAIFDAHTTRAKSLAGLQGPMGIRLHDPALSAVSQPLNRYLRFEAGLDERLREVAILATARELDSQFEWCAHEAEGTRVGLAPELIDTIRHRGPVDGLPEDVAATILLVRESLGSHRVTPATYARALKALGAKALLSYVSLIGNYASTAILLHVFDQQLPEGASGSL